MKKLQDFQAQALTTQGMSKALGGDDYGYTWNVVTEEVTIGNKVYTRIISQNSEPD